MFLAFFLAVLTQATPQRDTRPTPETATTGHATIRGRVVDGETGRPLSRARITLSAPELHDGGRTTSTNREGRYEINNLPAGHYALSVARSGFLTLRYGQRRALEQGKTLEVVENQRVDNVNFALPRMSLIAGRVSDEAGDPIGGVTVTVLRTVYADGVRQLAPDPSLSDTTDNDGAYRLSGLQPGTYVVMATFNDTWTLTEGGADTQVSYAPTYFPGTSNIAAARRLTLAVGQEARDTDFSLATGRAAAVSGTAFDSHGGTLQNVVVLQVSSGGSAGIRTFGGPGVIKVAEDGAFVIRNVPPGDYQLMASGHDELASIPITVDGTDMTGLSLLGTAGWSVTGRILTDEGSAPPLATSVVHVWAFRRGPAALFQLAGQPAYGQKVNPDWTFSISSVTGSARLLANLPPGWMLKEMLQDGKDIAEAPQDLESGKTLADVQVVITNHLARLSGQVTDEKSSPISDGTIIVFPADPVRWHENTRWVRVTRPNQSGRFDVTGLLPGEYLAIAVDYVELGQWNDPEYLESLRSHARAITLSATRPAEVALQLVTP